MIVDGFYNSVTGLSQHGPEHGTVDCVSVEDSAPQQAGRRVVVSHPYTHTHTHRHAILCFTVEIIAPVTPAYTHTNTHSTECDMSVPVVSRVPMECDAE